MNSNATTRWIARTLGMVLLVSVVMTTAGCGIHSAMTGASSMRVEVDTYIGPLSREWELQWAELEALNGEISGALDILADDIEITTCRLGCCGPCGRTDCGSVGERYDVKVKPKNLRKDNLYEICPTFKKMATDVKILKLRADGLSPQLQELSDYVASVRPALSKYRDEAARLGQAVARVWVPKTGPVAKELQELQTTIDGLARSVQTAKNADADSVFVRGVSALREDAGSLKQALSDYDESLLDSRAGALDVWRDASAFSREVSALATELASRAPRKLAFSSGVSPKESYEWQTGYDDEAGLSTDPDFESRLNYLKNAAALAESLRTQSLLWIQQYAPSAPKEMRARITLANYAAFANELANRLGSRADALLKLESEDARTLQTAVMLRDSGSTEFVNLYDWIDAATDRSRHKPPDRVRVVQRLIDDTNWEHVNTVYAGGIGDTTIALIKDDIGNWNLKSFDNRPGDLVEAYTKAGVAALQLAAKIAVDSSGAGPAIDGAQRLQQFADQMAFGGSTVAASSPQIESLNGHTLAQLNDLRTQYESRSGEIGAEIETAAGDLAGRESVLTSARSAMQDASANKRAADERVTLVAGQLETARARLTARLDPESVDPDEDQEDRDAAIEEARAEVGRLETQLTAARADATAQSTVAKTTEDEFAKALLEEARARSALTVLEAERDGLPGATTAEARRVLRSYSDLLNRMAASMTPEPGDELPQPPG